ncbi:hypothetical protein ACFSL4_36025 [Streptomyces caeni]|uniref:Uncharacterized protein n=1 Tax=Streptomyces caeni TaxID=2307231 RepID=A0ABW4J3J2_9ACTN
MPTRTFAVAAAVVGAAALATTGITYATSIVDANERAAPPGHHAAPSAQPSSPSAQRSASAAHASGSAGGKKENRSQENRSQENHEKQDHDKQGHDKQGHDKQGHDKQGHDKQGHNKQGQDKQLQGQGGGDHGDGHDRGHGYGFGDDRGYGYGYRHKGRIYFNGRTYSAHADGCVTVAKSLSSNSFNVYNDSGLIIEVFRGFTCDNAAPVATVGPHDRSNGVVARRARGGVSGDNDVVGSFRVIGRHHDDW